MPLFPIKLGQNLLNYFNDIVKLNAIFVAIMEGEDFQHEKIEINFKGIAEQLNYPQEFEHDSKSVLSVNGLNKKTLKRSSPLQSF